jgi:gliding motility-associated-like protein
MYLRITSVRSVLFSIFVLIFGVSVNAQNMVTFAGGAGDERFNCVFQLSDGTYLVGGQAQDLNWLPNGTPVITLQINEPVVSNATTIAFLMHITADMQTIARVLRFPDGTVRDVFKIKTTSLPGEPTGDIYISGSRDNTGSTASDGYYIARLNNNFVNGIPNGLVFYRAINSRQRNGGGNNVFLPVGSESYGKQMQTWDVGSNGFVIYSGGCDFCFDALSINAMGKSGRDTLIDYWNLHNRRGVSGALNIVPASSFINNTNDPAFELVNSSLWLKYSGTSIVGGFRSFNQVLYDQLSTDENGNTGRKGAFPFDIAFNSPQLIGGAPVSTGVPGYTGYSYNAGGGKWTAKVGDIVIDKRNNDFYISLMISVASSSNITGIDDVEPAVVACRADGSVKWWARTHKETIDHSPAQQQVEGLAINYATNELIVLGRTRAHSRNNFWKGNEIKANPGGNGFQNDLTGTIDNAAAPDFGWLGKYGLNDGKIKASTYVAELAPNATYSTPSAEANLDGWPNYNSFLQLGVTRLREVTVNQATGDIYVTGSSLRPFTTLNAFQKMLKPGAPGNNSGSAIAPGDFLSINNNNQPGGSFIRVYSNDLSRVIYSTMVTGVWNPLNGNNSNNTFLRGIFPIQNGVLFTGFHNGTGNSFPAINTPAWGRDTIIGQTPILGRLNFTFPPGGAVPAQPGPIVGPADVCQSTTLVYSVPAVPGATSYRWFIEAFGWTGFSTTNTITLTRPVNTPGGILYVVAVNEYGVSPQRAIILPGTNNPAAPNTPNFPQAHCVGQTLEYGVNTVPGAKTYNWQLTGPGCSVWSLVKDTTNVSATQLTLNGAITQPCSLSVTVTSCSNTSNPATFALPIGTPTVSSPIFDQTSGPYCQGSTRTFSVQPVAGATHYIWTLPNGFVGSSTNNSITITDTGSTTGGEITVVAVGACNTSAPASLVIPAPVPGSIPATPDVILGPEGFCGPDTITLSVTPQSGVTYNWTVFGGGLNLENNTGATVGVYGASGNGTGIVFVTASNFCGTSLPAQKRVQRGNPAFPTNSRIFGIPTSVCAGGSDTLYVTPNPRALSYTWALPPGWTSVTGPTPNSIIVTAGPGAQSGRVTVTAVGECGTANISGGNDSLYVGGQTITFTIANLTNNFEQCNNTTLTYWVEGSNLNAATRFSWILPEGWFVTNSSTTAPAWDTVQITAGLNPQFGILTVRAVGSNVCGVDTALLKPGAGDPPGSIAGPQFYCAGVGPLQYSVPPVIGADSLVWTITPANAGTVSGNGTTVTVNWSNTFTGIARLGVRAARACGLSPSSPLLEVTLGLPAPTVEGTTICAPGDVTITPSGAASFRYYNEPTGGSPIFTGASYTLNVLSTTTIYVSSFDPGSNCESAVRTPVTITIGGAPSAPVVNAIPPVCAGTTATLNVSNPIAGATYNWFVQGGNTVIFTGATFTTGPITSDTVFQVLLSQNGCESSRTNVTVTVAPTPSAPALPVSSVSRCGAGTVSVTPTSPGTFRVYDAQTGGNNLGEFFNTINLNVSASATVYIAAVIGGCESEGRTALEIIINFAPSAPVYLSGDTTLCAGNSTTLVVADVPNGTYTWFDAANNVIPGATNASYTTPIISANTTISVSVTVNGCESPKRTFIINIAPPPPAPTISNSVINICIGNSVTISPSGATNYNYYNNPTGGVAIGSGITYTYQPTATDTIYVSSVVGANCESATRTQVIINVLPPPNAPVLGGSSIICPGTSTTITATSTTPGASFRWFDASGQNELGTGPTLVITSPGTYLATASLGTCVSSATSITVTAGAAAPDFEVASEIAVCTGFPVTITPIGPGTFFYYNQQTGGNPIFLGPSYTFTPTANTTIYVASSSDDNCQSVERKAVLITVTPAPDAPTVSNNLTVCAGGTASITATTNVPGAEFRWSDASGTQVATGSVFTTAPLTQNTSFTVVAALGSCVSNPTTFTINVVESPAQPTISGATSTCAGTSVTLNASTTTEGAIIRWLNSDGTEAGTGNSFITPVLNASVTYLVEATLGSCSSERVEVIVSVTPLVNPSITAASTAVCAGGSLSVSVAEPGDGYVYQWSFGAVTPVVIGEGSSITTPAITEAGTITVVGIVGACTTATASLDITVNPLPVTSILPSRSVTINQGESVELTATGGVSYNWIPAASLSSSNTATVTATPNTTTRYQVIISDGTCSTTDTVLVTVISAPTLPVKIPAGFTPNGDNQNETWVIENITQYPNNKVTVLNRFGNVVFERSNYQNDWTGDNLPVATYYYVVDLGNGEKAKTGTVTIIK